MQASAIDKMGAEIAQHNKLLQQIAASFPSSYPGSSVYTFDFGAAFSQARAGSFCMCTFTSHI